MIAFRRHEALLRTYPERGSLPACGCVGMASVHKRAPECPLFNPPASPLRRNVYFQDTAGSCFFIEYGEQKHVSRLQHVQVQLATVDPNSLTQALHSPGFKLTEVCTVTSRSRSMGKLQDL